MSPQTAEAIPNGNDSAHELANGDLFGENGQSIAMGKGALPQTGKYPLCGRLLGGA